MLNVSATQELSRQLKDAQGLMQILKTENAKLSTSDREKTDMLKTMKAQIHAINDRLNMTISK
jgi:hypothetical protein